LLDYLGLPRQWGLIGLPLWLSLGFFQSRVLTRRFCQPLRWTLITAVGGVLGTLTSRALDELLPIPLSFNAERWESWLLQLLFAGMYALTGAFIGLFQWTALKSSGGSRTRWAVACALGAYGSALVSVSSSMLIWSQPIHSVLVGAAFGLITAGPLKRALWPQATEVAQPELPTHDAEIS
jgi:hypothetical protein